MNNSGQDVLVQVHVLFPEAELTVIKIKAGHWAGARERGT